MSVTELKHIVDQSTPEERRFLREYLAEFYPDEDTFHREQFDRRMREMDAGKKTPWSEVVKAHERLKAQGL